MTSFVLSSELLLPISINNDGFTELKEIGSGVRDSLLRVVHPGNTMLNIVANQLSIKRLEMP